MPPHRGIINNSCAGIIRGGPITVIVTSLCEHYLAAGTMHDKLMCRRWATFHLLSSQPSSSSSPGLPIAWTPDRDLSNQLGTNKREDHLLIVGAYYGLARSYVVTRLDIQDFALQDAPYSDPAVAVVSVGAYLVRSSPGHSTGVSDLKP